jgi:hypothetical protein
MQIIRLFTAFLAVALLVQTAAGQDSRDLASKLSNPLASLISVPFQYSYNSGFLNGTADQAYINIQPVVPISIGEDWNLISRTILPVVTQEGFVPSGRQTGFGNTVQSFFFSPKEPTAGGLIWGAGPVVQLPTNTDGLGADQWGLGLTGVVLKQNGGWTYGALANHVWTVTNNSVYGEQSVTFLQPFLSFTTPQATTFGLNAESTYNWNTEEWSVPINLAASQLVKIAGRPVQIGVGVRYWADSPTGGPDDWGARLSVTYLFPR